MTEGVLADACALIAFHIGTGGMSAAGLRAMQEGPVLISPITVWEITRKAWLGKRPPPPVGADGSFAGWLREAGYREAPLGWTIAAAAAANALPDHHRDPMDRMVIATAFALGVPVVTCDAPFASYGVPVLW